jgi:hypothetical protein
MAVEKGSNNFSHSVTVSEDIKTKKNCRISGINKDGLGFTYSISN